MPAFALAQTDVADDLRRLDDEGLRRHLRAVRPLRGGRVELDGVVLVDFSSNDYLGLASCPELARAGARAAEKYGSSARASRLVAGNYPLLAELESALAEFKRTEAALVYPAGYMANLGVLSALAGKGDLVVMDRLAHASIVDGARLSGAVLKVYRHRDVADLDAILVRRRADSRRAFIVTDTVFSMDGDLAPLADIASVARRHGAMTIVDDAHGTGVYGACGRGVLEHLGAEGEMDVVVGTLSKALGCQGGFVAADREVVDFLVNRSRSFMYTTGLAPSICGSALAALELIRTRTGLRQRLWTNAFRLKEGLERAGIASGEATGPILPVVVGSARKALAVSRKLEQAGFLGVAVRPPTVPRRASRIRLSAHAAHSGDDIDGLVAVLAAALEELETYG